MPAPPPRPEGKPTGSIVVPVFNEADGLERFLDEVTAALEGSFSSLELIFVDDGSTDASVAVLRELHARDPRVKVVGLARNFGSHTAIAAGLDRAQGDVVLVMAADLQDPPPTAVEMVAAWRAGADIVWGVREGRSEGLLRRAVARSFYAMIRWLALPTYPKTGTGSFCLMDAKVVRAVRSFPERNRVTFGIVSWTGFPQAQVAYERPARSTGRSNWTLGMMIKTAVDTLVSFSYAPIRFASVVGIVSAVIGILAAVYLIFASVVFGAAVAGWPSLIVTMLVVGGLCLFILGILGEYIWRIAEEVKGRPLYIVGTTVGTDPDGSAGGDGDGR